jgi:hypothetical protein
MPHRPDDTRYPHLEFTREAPSAARRKPQGRSGPPLDRGPRETYGAQLLEAAERVIEAQAQKRPPPAGIQPHLVFRIPLAKKARLDTVTELLQQSGLTVVSVEVDGAIVAFRDDVDLRAFQNAIRGYQAGPRVDRFTGELAATSRYDVLAYLEAQEMRLWSRADRVGTRLAQAISADGARIQPEATYTLDVELWHPGTAGGVRGRFDELQRVVNAEAEPEERVLDEYRGSFLLLAKVRVRGSTLDRLLDLDGVAEVELPPVARFEPLAAAQTTGTQFNVLPRTSEDGPRVCVIDSGIVANHPLLAANVGHEEAVLTSGDSPSDTNGHGTMVGAIAVFGDIRACYEARAFASPITLFSARVLNDAAGFDDETLVINQLRRVIELFSVPPHNCRVFNLSIGSFAAGIDEKTRRQNQYAEVLDILAREYGVLLVVAAGNHQEASASTSEEGERVLRDYPQLLFRPAARLNDFATAAIPLTVGAVAQVNEIAARRATVANDVIVPLTHPGEPSPMTRVGPGLMDAIKPEFVHYGGSLVFDRGVPGKIRHDHGLAVMSFSHHPTETLFAYNCGTSFAAPQVARLAALVEHRLRQALGISPHPNLIRAMLATAAEPPEGSGKRLDEHMCIKACGYGLPEEELALESSDRRVTLYAQDQILLDHFHVYRVPVPDEFLRAEGIRRIRVALAFDPPVRGRRLDYLGAEMNMALIRGKTLADVERRFSRAGPDVTAETAFPPKYQAKLHPSSSSRNGGYKRKKSTLQVGTFTIKGGSPEAYGNDYWLVVIAQNKWALPDVERLDYAVAVTIEANAPGLYVRVQQRIRPRVRVRV